MATVTYVPPKMMECIIKNASVLIFKVAPRSPRITTQKCELSLQSLTDLEARMMDQIYLAVFGKELVSNISTSLY
jgi:hypothetical protein